MKSNFEFLSKYWPDIAQLGSAAESYLYSDPNACVFKLGLISERIVSEILSFEKLPVLKDAAQANKIKILKREGLLPSNIDNILFALRKARNDAVHTGLNSFEKASTLMRMTYNLSVWFMEVYGDWDYKPGEYENPNDYSRQENFNQLLSEQEARIAELTGEISEIRTSASEIPAEERAKKSVDASQKLNLSDDETHYLISEQVRMDINVTPVVNFALQQNRVPIVQSMAVVNNSTDALENIDLRITSSPELCLPYAKHIDYIPENSMYDVKNIQLILNSEYLAGLTEKVIGLLHISLAAEDKLLYSEDIEITALAFDEWHGYSFYPELLAAFVTPNHPEIVKLNARAAELLGKWTEDPSLDAYQTKDPNRVMKQAAAIFGAIQEQNIVYAVPPASFERVGQRVRLCDAVISQKMGTCLDLTLLYASCLEAVGLHPLLVLKKGHIFAGVWLEDLAFPESVQDDASMVTKRLAEGVNEIAIMECTLLVAGKRATFDDARETAEHAMTGTEPIEYIIDVNRARLSGVSPLPLRVATNAGWRIEREVRKDSELTSAPKSVGGAVTIADVPESQMSKKVQWERKLLDLGLRNPLINMRLSKNMIPILSSSLADLEDALSDGSDFSIFSRPADLRAFSDDSVFESIHDLGAYKNVIKSEFQNKRLRSILSETDLTRAIKDLYRSAKTSLEENGANTVYLALGLLRWYETDRSTKARYAPVVLLPIEIIRKSANQGYVIRLRDDEPQVNITLLEKIKQDFGILVNGLDPIPQDEHGIDIRKIFTILRKAVMEQTRWDVLESAYLGSFSFSQFVMWNDIRNRSDELMKNKLVRSLMEGKLVWDAAPMDIGERVSEESVFLPIPADASQLYAIEAACKGESFVLHGPPGTGKSQTITALIANALAQGKTVLFVAEKMAALEVVQKRLVNIGLDPFCMELHSNKSKKKDVLEQLRLATEVTKHQTVEAYASKAEQISVLRSELDEYTAQLHKKLPCGQTLYELINGYEENKSAPDIAAFSPGVLEQITGKVIEQQNMLIERMVAAAKAIGHPYNHPLKDVGCTQYSQQLRMALPGAVSAYKSALFVLREACDRFSASTSMTSPKCYSDLEKLADISKELSLWLAFPRAWAVAENFSSYLSNVEEMAQHYISANNIYTKLSETWNPDFFTNDGAALSTEFKELSTKWFLAKMIGLNKLSKRLTVYAKLPVFKEELRNHIADLAAYQAEEAAGDNLLSSCGSDWNHLLEGSDTNWPQVLECARVAEASAAKLYDICGTNEILVRYGGVDTLAGAIDAMNEAWQSLLPAKDSLYSLLSLASGADTDEWFQQQIKMCENIAANTDDIKEWITWKEISNEAIQIGLQPVVDAYCAGITHEDVQSAYRKEIYRELAAHAIDDSPVLNTFSGTVFNEKVEQFKRIDEELIKLTQQEIFCRLAARIPNFAREAAQSSELGILQRAIRSGGRGLSIRKLFEQISNLLPRLCPCMLMSPISAAQYLDPKREPFDIVVFDEASQLPTCKAVGALARGTDAIIVGDPKQMPPTSFFVSNTVDEDNLEIEDLESILDDCLALNMPQTHLLWHYRSRHESLIAFSNKEFYENSLYTFPSVNDRESKVNFVKVDGYFDRGKTRQNRAEAEAIIEEIKRRSRDEKSGWQTIGVVTFNISQQHLIDDLLEEARGNDAELDTWINESKEPLFVKNLENVQGDERDVILFSVGYGPDKDGKIYMNFGPLNREGGWRRLNVAVSRARCEMMVFSTLTPDQIDLSKTRADGVIALKAFLEYAMHYNLSADENMSTQLHLGKQGIVNAICTALKEHGYETNCFVGHSKYRIDIGIIDPKDLEKYLLGILLDGPNYGSAKTTHDRELAQVSVLNGLGWNVLRVWTMDWWDNSRKEIDRILAELTRIQDTAIYEAPKEIKNRPVQIAAAAKHVEREQPRIAQAYTKPSPTAAKVKVYSATALDTAYISSDDFLLPQYNRTIQTRVAAAIEHEAPISEGMLTRRIIQSFGIARAGNRIQARMGGVYSSMCLKSTTFEGQKFFWSNHQNPDDYSGFRASGDADNKRDAKDVPVQEAANAICYVLFEQISLSEDDLIREAAKLLGYSRLGNVVVSLFESAIRHANQKTRIELGTNGNWILCTSEKSYVDNLASNITC